MKLCIVSTDFPSSGKHVYIFVEQLVNQLLLKGIEITVIAPQSLTHAFIHREPIREKKKNAMTIDGIKYKVLRPFILSAGDKSACLTNLFNVFKRKSIENIIEEEKPDILYAHFWDNALIIESIARKFNIPLFVACGEGDDALESINKRLSLMQKKELRTTVTGVISVSTENKRKCLTYGLAREDNIIVLPNCVDTNVFKLDKSNNIRKELGIKDTDYVVLFCGTFIKRKGSKRLSDAITVLNDSAIKSIFIGKPFNGEDESPNCDGIVFMGTVKHDDLPKYLNSADVFVLPTLKEGCSNAIVEALSCGLPVISSDRPFNQDILDASNSIMIDPMDVNEIANAIKMLKEDFDLRTKMSEGAIMKASSLRLDVRAEKIIEFMNKQIS